MREQLHFRAFIWLSVIALVLLSGLGLLHRWQMYRNAAELRVLADRAEQQGRPDRAARFLGLYLADNPNDVEARADYGIMIESLATTSETYPRAAQIYDEVLADAPDRGDIRKRLVRLQIVLGSYTEALSQVKTLRDKLPDDPKDANKRKDAAVLEFQRGLCHEGLLEFSQAALAHGRAINLDKSLLGAYQRRADILRRHLKRPEEATDAMDAMVDASVKLLTLVRSAQTAEPVEEAKARLAAAHLVRARYRLLQGERGAEEDLEGAVQLAPDDSEVLLTSAEAAKTAGKVDQARDHLRRAVDKNPQDERCYRALALLEARAGHLDRGVTCLRQGLTRLPGNAELLLSLAAFLLEQQEIDATQKVVEQIRQWGISDGRLTLLEAQLQITEGRWKDARNLLESKQAAFLEGDPQQLVQQSLLLGQCYQQLGENELELGAYRRATRAGAQNELAQLALAKSLVRLGHRSEAIQHYQSLLAQGKAPPDAWLTYAQLMVVDQLSLPPARAKARWPEVEQVLNTAGKKLPGSLGLALLWADVRSAQDKPAEAQAILEDACKQHPERVEVWVALASHLAQQEPPDRAQEVLQEAEKKLGPLVELDRARLQLASSRTEAVKRGVLEAVEKHRPRYTPAEQLSLLQWLAVSHARWRDLDTACDLWLQVIRESPQNLTPRFHLFDLAFQMLAHAMQEKRGGRKEAGQDLEAALKLMEQMVHQIEEIEGPDGPLGHYGEAVLLLARAWQGERDGLKEARQHLVAAAVKRPSWPLIPATRGMIAEQEGSPDEALTEYLRAIELGERRLVVVRQAVQMLHERDRSTEAHHLIQHLESRDFYSPELQRLAAEISLRNAEPGRALELALNAVPKDTRDYKDKIWLAHVQASAGKKKEALGSLRDAIQLGGQAGEPWIALVQYRVYLKEKDEAEKVIREARESLKGDQAHATLARCYEFVDKRAQAEAEYHAAVEARPDDLTALRQLVGFYQRTKAPEKAAPLLRQILGSDQKQTPEELAWARRNLAVCLAGRKDAAAFKEALGLVQSNLADEPGSAPDLYIKVRLLENRPEFRKEAVAGLQQLLDQENLSRDTRADRERREFHLAQLQARLADWPKARQKMLDILSREGDNADYVEAFISQLLEHGETSDVELWLDRLEQLTPNAATLLVLRARLLGKLDRGEEAIPLARKFVEAGKGTTDLLSRLRGAASVLEQLGEQGGKKNSALLRAAEEMYRKAMDESDESGKPAEALALATFLGRQHSFTEALALWEQARKKSPPEDAALAGTAIVCAGPARTEQLDAVEQFLARSQEGAARPAVFLKLRAMVQAHRGQYGEAERTYRLVVRQSADDSSVLNNLALMLVLQNRDLDQAAELLERAMQQSGATGSLLDTRGMLRAQKGRLEDAIADFKEAIAQEPGPVRLLHLAHAYQRAGRREEALAPFQRAQRLGVERNLVLPAEEQIYRQLRKDLGPS